MPPHVTQPTDPLRRALERVLLDCRRGAPAARSVWYRSVQLFAVLGARAALLRAIARCLRGDLLLDSLLRPAFGDSTLRWFAEYTPTTVDHDLRAVLPVARWGTAVYSPRTVLGLMRALGLRVTFQYGGRRYELGTPTAIVGGGALYGFDLHDVRLPVDAHFPSGAAYLRHIEALHAMTAIPREQLQLHIMGVGVPVACVHTASLRAGVYTFRLMYPVDAPRAGFGPTRI